MTDRFLLKITDFDVWYNSSVYNNLSGLIRIQNKQYPLFLSQIGQGRFKIRNRIVADLYCTLDIKRNTPSFPIKADLQIQLKYKTGKLLLKNIPLHLNDFKNTEKNGQKMKVVKIAERQFSLEGTFKIVERNSEQQNSVNSAIRTQSYLSKQTSIVRQYSPVGYVAENRLPRTQKVQANTKVSPNYKNYLKATKSIDNSQRSNGSTFKKLSYQGQKKNQAKSKQVNNIFPKQEDSVQNQENGLQSQTYQMFEHQKSSNNLKGIGSQNSPQRTKVSQAQIPLSKNPLSTNPLSKNANKKSNMQASGNRIYDSSEHHMINPSQNRKTSSITNQKRSSFQKVDEQKNTDSTLVESLKERLNQALKQKHSLYAQRQIRLLQFETEDKEQKIRHKKQLQELKKSHQEHLRQNQLVINELNSRLSQMSAFLQEADHEADHEAYYPRNSPLRSSQLNQQHILSFNNQNMHQNDNLNQQKQRYINQLYRKNSQLLALNEYLQEQLKTAEMEAKKREDQEKLTNKEQNQIANQNASLKFQNNKLSSQKSKLEQELKMLESQKQSLFVQMSRLKQIQGNQRNLNQENELRQKSNELRQKDNELEAKDTELEAKNIELEAKDTELRQKDTELRQKDIELRQKDIELKEQDNQFRAKSIEAKQLSNGLGKKQMQIQKLKNEIEILKSELEQKQKIIRELISLTGQLQLRVKQISAGFVDIERNLKNNQTSNNRQQNSPPNHQNGYAVLNSNQVTANNRNQNYNNAPSSQFKKGTSLEKGVSLEKEASLGKDAASHIERETENMISNYNANQEKQIINQLLLNTEFLSGSLGKAEKQRQLLEQSLSQLQIQLKNSQLIISKLNKQRDDKDLQIISMDTVIKKLQDQSNLLKSSNPQNIPQINSKQFDQIITQLQTNVNNIQQKINTLQKEQIQVQANKAQNYQKVNKKTRVFSLEQQQGAQIILQHQKAKNTLVQNPQKPRIIKMQKYYQTKKQKDLYQKPSQEAHEIGQNNRQNIESHNQKLIKGSKSQPQNIQEQLQRNQNQLKTHSVEKRTYSSSKDQRRKKQKKSQNDDCCSGCC